MTGVRTTSLGHQHEWSGRGEYACSAIGTFNIKFSASITPKNVQVMNGNKKKGYRPPNRPQFPDSYR